MPTNQPSDIVGQLTGPADTLDPSVRVSTARSVPTDADLQAGTVAGTVAMPAATVLPTLQLVGDRIERYELVAPDGVICEIVRNMDTGEHKTTRTKRRAWPLPTSPDAA